MKLKRKYGLGVDVVTAARQRIKNIFANGLPVAMSFSGGKDSLCMDHLTYELCSSGQVDKSLLTVYFIDEEAIYPCVERIVKACRAKWLSIGVNFEWYAMEYKHFNCLNSLSQDETFICFDRTKQDRWIRQPPPYAIRTHPLLVAGKDTYQVFCEKRWKKHIDMVAIRASESFQRQEYLLRVRTEIKRKLYPIYDWHDRDVWKYLLEKNIDIPEAYIHMWQSGVSKNKLRISQFFSVDTVGSLVKMCEYYPELFDKICKREPNAYMAMLYYDTELFRHQKGKQESNINEACEYKNKTLDIFKNPQKYNINSDSYTYKGLKRFVVRFSYGFGKKDWKNSYQALVGGDPKGRTLRSIKASVFANISKE